MTSNLRSRGAGALSEDDLKMLRGLILRRRRSDADRWLRMQGFSERAVRDIILEQELALSNLLYLSPRREFIVAAVLGFVAFFFLGLAGSEAGTLPLGERTNIDNKTGAYVLVGLACVGAGIFALRGIWGMLSMRAALIRYPVRADTSWMFQR